MTPLISVILPAYNCEAYIGAAIKSVLDQSFRDFELIIIDDASTDGTKDVIKTFKDGRVILIEKPKNTGYTHSLNFGLGIAKGKYIARMDADDVALPLRLEIQVQFMEDHPDCVACGSNYEIIGSPHIVKMPEQHEDIKIRLLSSTCFGHPTVMLRKAILDYHSLGYDTTMEPAEDYALWVTLLAYGKLYNIQDVLLKYRVHDSQVSHIRRQEQLLSKMKTRINLLEYLDVTLDDNQQLVLRNIMLNEPITFKDVAIFETVKSQLLKANVSGFFKTFEFSNYINDMERRMFKTFFVNRKHYHPKIFYYYLKVTHKKNFRLTFKETLKLLTKSLLFYSVNS